MNNNDNFNHRYDEQNKKSFIESMIEHVGGNLRRDIHEIEKDAYAEGVSDGQEKTVVMLYDAGVEDRKIIELLNKHWDISMDDAAMWLRHGKIQHCLEVLNWHLISQGFSKGDVGEFIRKNRVNEKLETRPELLKLKDNGQKIKEALEKEE